MKYEFNQHLAKPDKTKLPTEMDVSGTITLTNKNTSVPVKFRVVRTKTFKTEVFMDVSMDNGGMRGTGNSYARTYGGLKQALRTSIRHGLDLQTMGLEEGDLH